MLDKNNSIRRRSVLVATGGLTFTGSGSSKREPDNNRGKSGHDSGGMSLNNKNKVSDKGKWATVLEKSGRIDDAETFLSGPDIGANSISGSNPEMSSLKYVSHWKQESSTSPDCIVGDGKTEGEHLVTAYKVQGNNGDRPTNEDGDYPYLLELYSKEERVDKFALCGGPYITKLRQKIESQSDSSYVEFNYRDPATGGRVNDDRVTVRQGRTIGNVGYAADKVMRFHDGYFGPDTWTPGPDGEYAIEWESNGPQFVKRDIIAFVEISHNSQDLDLDINGGLDWSWDVSTVAE
jgi:hypothetical protein